MKAETDNGPVEKNSGKPGYIQNVFSLMKLVSNEIVLEKYEDDYKNCIIRYGDMKKQLAEDMIKFISPIRKKVNAILDDEAYLKKVMQHGAEKARESAGKTIKLVREAMGLNYL
jgi:tryptophanyl-tRNA synthetase